MSEDPYCMKIVDGTPYIKALCGMVTDYAAEFESGAGACGLAEGPEEFSRLYTPPEGRIFAALTDDGDIAGCVAMRRLSDDRCELRHLLVRREYRKRRVGVALVAALMEQAVLDGYEEIVLDTLRAIPGAQALYRGFGFRETEPYYDSPIDNVVYMRLVIK